MQFLYGARRDGVGSQRCRRTTRVLVSSALQIDGSEVLDGTVACDFAEDPVGRGVICVGLEPALRSLKEAWTYGRDLS